MATKGLAFKPLNKKPQRKTVPFFPSAIKKKKKETVPVRLGVKGNKKETQDPVLDPKKASILDIQKAKITKTAKSQKKHGTADEKKEETQKAVKINPALEKSSVAKSNQVEAMAAPENKPKKFDSKKFSDDILSNIKKVIPKNREEMEKDQTSSEKMGQAQQNVTDSLDKEKQASNGELTNAVGTNPDQASVVVKEALPLPKEDIGAIPNASNSGFAPPIKTAQDNDLSADSKKIDDELTKNDVSETQLENGNEPDFNNSLKEKKESQKKAEGTNQQYLKIANPIVGATKNSTQTLTAGGLAKMNANRNKQLSQVDKNKEIKKQKEEEVRTKVASDLNKIYDDTKRTVEAILSSLSSTVNLLFDVALIAANANFEKNVKERTDKNWLEKAIDAVMGLPFDIKKIFQEEQDNFINYLKPTVTRIGELVEQELNKATNEIEKGKATTKSYWEGQSTDTQRIAGEVFTNATERFSELDSKVNEANVGLKQSITTKFNAAVSKLQETFDKIQEENKSWLDRAYDAVVGVIKAILEMKDLLFTILAKVADVIGKIISDPIGFLSNLLDAIILGFQNFGKNILEHLKKGFFEWLMGNMPPSIKFPKQWDITGILEFVLSIFGVSWENIKARATKMYGATVVAALETGFEIFQIIRKEGIGGLWNYIKEKIGNLQVMVVDAIQNMLIETVIKAGITWVISLFNPAGAFIKACKLIYDVISWFINNAKRILDLINSIVDSVALIVAGKITQAATFVENSLARLVPIAIGFLAGLLGLGDLSKKVQALLDKIQAPVNKAIDWVLEMAGKAVKGLFKAGKAGLNKLMQFLGFSKPFNLGTEKHTLLFKEINGNPEFIVQSYPTKYNVFIENLKFKKESKKEEAKKLGVDVDKKLNQYKNESEEEKRKKWADEIVVPINSIAKIIEEYAEIGENEENVPSIISYKSTNVRGLATGVEAKQLTMNNIVGQETGEQGDDKSLTPDFDIIRKNKGKYVRGHLLNAKLGGLVNNTNLTPLTRDTNKNHLNFVEKAAKKIVTGKSSSSDTISKKGIAYYKVDVIYGIQNRKLSNLDADKQNIDIVETKQGVVPTGITVLLKKLKIQDKKIVDDTTFTPISGSLNNKIPETIDT
jgi:hypothetical protein